MGDPSHDGCWLGYSNDEDGGDMYDWESLEDSVNSRWEECALPSMKQEFGDDNLDLDKADDNKKCLFINPKGINDVFEPVVQEIECNPFQMSIHHAICGYK